MDDLSPVSIFAGVSVASATLLKPRYLAASPVRYRVCASFEPFLPSGGEKAERRWLGGDEAATVAAMRRGSTCYLIFAGVAQARIEPKGRITVWRDPAADEASFHHAILDQFLPRALAGDGELMLHAAGVVIAAPRALLVLGETGHGKSTLCAALVHAGARLLTDDCVRVVMDDGVARAIPSYPSLRLLPDSLAAVYGEDAPATEPMADYTAKRRVLGVRADSQPVAGSQASSDGQVLDSGGIGAGAGRNPEIGAIVVLNAPHKGSDATIRLQPLSAADACMAIVQNSFALDPTDMTWVRAQLGRAAALSDAVPAYSLSYPRDYARLPEVVARLRELAARQS